MWGVTAVFFYYVATQQVASGEIKVKCSELVIGDHYQQSNATPSFLMNLTVTLVLVKDNCMLNISWAINIDASIQYLTGTLILIDNEPSYLCEYNPNLSKAVLSGSKQRWFYYLVNASYGSPLIQAMNLPFPHEGGGVGTKYTMIHVPCRKKQHQTTVTPKPDHVPTDVSSVGTTTLPLQAKHVTVVILGGLAGVMILSSCYIIYKNCGAHIAKSFGFKRLTASPMVPVPVLMVYSAENSAFQQAVVALAEFLQWHGGCSVAVDIWQQGKIAELGPMRWLAEQVSAADRVLIVCPQVETPRHSAPSHSLSEPSIPAAAHDLYPLILNMVASHARSASELAKFWVVQLGKQQDKRPSSLALELRACKTFCLMKNLNKLCRSLHTQRQDKKMPGLVFRPVISYNEQSTVKLKEAVEMLIRHPPSISIEMKPLQSVANCV